MGKALRIHVLKESYYRLDPPEGKVIYSDGKKTKEEELIKAKDIDERIDYPLLNPIQTVFYKFYKGGNALVASPTSSGKSLIAYLFMRNFEGRIVYTVPTRSLAKEKLLEFKRYYPNNVELRTGENVLEGFKEVKAKVVVSTYEHLAYSLRNRARWLEGLSAVVIDEVHQILKRWILEEIITSCIRDGVPMLCLSATLPGVEELSSWIGAELVIGSAWRPVPLYRSVESLVHYKPIRHGLEGEELLAGRLLNALFFLKNRDESVILFVPKKSLGWKLLELASKERIGIMNQTLPFEVEEEREPEIAFHNADVPKEEREEIEKAFREGRLKTLIATQTLAYGVNLPADRVIILTRFFRSRGKLKSIPDTLDILQMEGRAGRFGIRDVGYSNLLVYGAKEKDLERDLSQALNKPFSTATMEEGESLDILSFFLLLAHLYERDMPERYLESTYSFRHVSKEKVRKVESFLRSYGYLEGNTLSQKGLFCVRTGIPPTRFESFVLRKSLQLDTMTCIRPLLYMKRFDSLFFFLKEKERFEEDLQYIRGMLLPCGVDCLEDNTEQFLFYVEGITVRYANLKNPPGEFSYLSTDAIHLLRVLMDINKPFSTATMEEGESLDILSFFLLLAHLYERDMPERYLESTYSFRHVSKEKVRKVESFLRSYGYLEGNTLSQKGLFCVRTGIPPTRFESFVLRKSLQLDTMTCIRPLLYMKRFDSLFFFLKEKERFEEDLQYIRGMLLPCGVDCLEDNTEQFLFYVEGITVRYANLKNPPGEFSYLSTDAIHLLRVLMDINKHGFYRFSTEEMIRIAHSVKYGIRPEYGGLAGIKGIGHIRANLLKEVLIESKVNPPSIGEPTANFLDIMEAEKLYDLLLEKVIDYRSLSTDRARDEVSKIRKILLNNRRGYMVDDKILLALGLFLEGPSAMKRTKKELVELIRWS